MSSSGTTKVLLHHYCSLDSFLGIVSSRSVWASNARFLNDYEEIEGAREVIASNLDQIEKRINRMRGRTEVMAALDQLIAGSWRVHVISFSRAADRLSQWRAYAEGGRGVCIGFDRTDLQSLGFRLGDVIYGSSMMLDAAMSWCVEAASTGGRKEAGKQDLYRSLVHLVAMAKSEEFVEEVETRLVIFDEDNDRAGPLRFRRSGLFITSYRPVLLESIWGTALRELCLGPALTDRDTKASLLEFLKESGSNDTLVKNSRATFRGW